MNLYAYTSLESFWKMISQSNENDSLSIRLPNLMYVSDDTDRIYGLSVLRNAIEEYEKRNNIPQEQSKAQVPFFRNDRVMLVGPDKEMYVLPLSEQPDNPDWWSKVLETETKVAIGFDYFELADYCMSQNLFLLKCKYDPETALKTFIDQLSTEYDTFDFDEENSSFKTRTRFFSMMYNACLELKQPEKREEKEWRLTSFASASEVQYAFENEMILPYQELYLPSTSLKSICIQTQKNTALIISGIRGLLEKAGYNTELIEIRESVF